MRGRVSFRVCEELTVCFSPGTEGVAFDTGYAGPNGIEPQSWVNGNGTSYIYFGSGQFDGQGSGHDFSGTVSSQPTWPRILVRPFISFHLQGMHQVPVWSPAVSQFPWACRFALACQKVVVSARRWLCQFCGGLTSIVDVLSDHR